MRSETVEHSVNKQLADTPTSVPDPTPQLEQLGKEILARVESGNKARQKSEDHYKAAGLRLLDAKKLAPDFDTFLTEHCDGLGRTRALELIAIAEGRTSNAEINAKANERKKRHRATKAETVRSGTDSQTTPPKQNSQPKKQSISEAALTEFKVACDIWFAKMDAADRKVALAYATEKATAVYTKLAA